MNLESIAESRTDAFLNGIYAGSAYSFSDLRERLVDAGIVRRGPIGHLQAKAYVLMEHRSGQGIFYFEKDESGKYCVRLE